MALRIIPAIDLLDGRVVALEKGDPATSQPLVTSAMEYFYQYSVAGAEELHLVDWSATRDPKSRPKDLIRQLCASVPQVCVQVTGGVRGISDVAELVDLGVGRVVLKSLLLRKMSETLLVLQQLGGDRVTFSIDLPASTDDLLETLSKWVPHGLQRVLVTDPEKVGQLSGPNFELYRRLKNEFPALEIQAAGGVSSLADLEELKNSEIDSVVVGRALTDKKFTYEEARAKFS